MPAHAQVARVAVADDQWLALRASIDELNAIAGRLARSAVAHGASWADGASPLRIDADQARAAYGERQQKP